MHITSGPSSLGIGRIFARLLCQNDMESYPPLKQLCIAHPACVFRTCLGSPIRRPPTSIPLTSACTPLYVRIYLKMAGSSSHMASSATRYYEFLDFTSDRVQGDLLRMKYFRLLPWAFVSAIKPLQLSSVSYTTTADQRWLVHYLLIRDSMSI